jgi:hypothetical protein
MRYDLSQLTFELQLQFIESVKEVPYIEDNYYRVSYDTLTNEFLLIKIGYVVRNKNSVKKPC